MFKERSKKPEKTTTRVKVGIELVCTLDDDSRSLAVIQSVGPIAERGDLIFKTLYDDFERIYNPTKWSRW